MTEPATLFKGAHSGKTVAGDIAGAVNFKPKALVNIKLAARFIV